MAFRSVAQLIEFLKERSKVTETRGVSYFSNMFPADQIKYC